MIVTDNINAVQKSRWTDPALRWGFVPTMGALHQGHLSLVRRARAENDRVAVSIYVNPTQFAPTEDLAAYPRNLESDLALLKQENVDLVFTPSDRLMYPSNFQTYVTVEDVTRPLEGASRPTHFRGVTTVVAKLFNIVQPNRAYFGQKDAQQVVVLKRMVDDLNFNLEMIICPIAREADGLAMSSRNVYLSAEQRAAALVLSQTLTAAQQAFEAGERNGTRLQQLMVNSINAQPLARLDYVSVADAVTLAEVTGAIEGQTLLSMAVFFGKTRLIDNMLLGG